MTSVVKRFLSLFIVAIFIGAGVPGIIFPVYISAVVLLVLLLWVNAATVTNLPLYGMGGVLLVGSLCGKAGVVAFKDMSPEQWEWVVSWGAYSFSVSWFRIVDCCFGGKKKVSGISYGK